MTLDSLIMYLFTLSLINNVKRHSFDCLSIMTM